MQGNLQIAAFEGQLNNSHASVLKGAFTDLGKKPVVESQAALYRDFSTCLNIAFLLNCQLLGEIAACLDRSLSM